MPAKSQAPTRAELEKVFKRPLSDAEYRGMLNINPAPAVAREAAPPPATPFRKVVVPAVAPTLGGDAAPMEAPMAVETPYQSNGATPSQPVKPLFGLPSNATPEAQAKAAMPFWLADSAGGHAAGDVATAPEYVQMTQAQNAPPVAPVATMEPAPGTPTTQALADGAVTVPAPVGVAMIAPKKEKK